ncbi:MAG: TIGR03620 family F420-dependent LLM class oxidoreductase [Candidatus Rokuibacteriota bacterium]
MDLGRLGVWASMDGMTAAAAAGFAQTVEGWGYGALWLPESRGRNVLVLAGWLLAHTKTLTIATGIANIYARDAQATAAGQLALAEQSGGRFLLGLGVSHVPLVEGLRGHVYGKPVETMRGYVAAMRRAPYAAPPPPEAPKTVIAALGPKMLELARSHTDGAHPYLVPPAHTKEARRILGSDKLLCPEQTVLLESDPTRARRIARAWLARYLDMANYRNNLLRLGFAEADVAGGGSDRLVDALIAWGDAAAIRRRVEEHRAAGADHVCVQALNPNEATPALPDERLLAALAPIRV